MTDSGLVVCKASFFSGNQLVRAGDVWDAGDPVVKHYPAAFKPLEVQKSRPVASPSRPAGTTRRVGRKP